MALAAGQPDYAPELAVIRDYDIDDYRTKSELTRNRLLTSLFTALHACSHIHTLELSRKRLERIIAASAGLFRRSSLRSFCEGVLLQLSGLLDVEANGFVLARINAGFGLEALQAAQRQLVEAAIRLGGVEDDGELAVRWDVGAGGRAHGRDEQQNDEKRHRIQPCCDWVTPNVAELVCAGTIVA